MYTVYFKNKLNSSTYCKKKKKKTPIPEAPTFYTDANKMGMASYKSDKISKVIKSPYTSVQKSQIYAVLTVLLDYPESLNIITDSLYAERVILHIETAEFVPDNSELTILFIPL